MVNNINKVFNLKNHEEEEGAVRLFDFLLVRSIDRSISDLRGSLRLHYLWLFFYFY